MVAPERLTPGHHRQALDQADAERLAERDVGDALLVALGRGPLDRQDRDAAEQQRPGDDQRAAEHRLDPVDQDEADHRRGQEADDDVAEEAPGFGLPPDQADQHRPEGPPVEHDHGEDRAQLDDDVEHRPARGVVAEQFAGEDQMAGRGDRDELGDALDDAEQDDGEDRRPWRRGLSGGEWRPVQSRHPSSCESSEESIALGCARPHRRVHGSSDQVRDDEGRARRIIDTIVSVEAAA